MSLFGLDSDSVVARVRASSGSVRIPSAAESILVGGAGFCLVSSGVYATVAFCAKWMYQHLGELGAYTAWMALFILLAGGTLNVLVIGPDRLRRFYALFALAFFLYAGVWVGSYFSLRTPSGEWISAYFPLRSRSGELLGSLLGPAILGMTFANAFAAPGAARRVIGVLFLTHSAGYFVGDVLHQRLEEPIGMLLWGVSYGLGFGAGIGYTLYACQEPVRRRLKGMGPPAAASTLSR